MKMTLLEMVQKILSSMDSDEVTSITDTTESQQVADLIEVVYNDIIAQGDFPESYKIYQLTETSVSTPNVMSLPTNVTSMEWLKYDKRETGDTESNFEDIKYMPLDQFLQYTLNFTNDTGDVDEVSVTIGLDSITFKCYTNIHPTYYTTFNDSTLIFDSYDSSIDTYLRKTKTLAYGTTVPSFTMSDSFTPELDAKQFTILFNEAKALAWAEVKQAQHPKAERNARRGWITSQKTKYAVQDRGYRNRQRLPNYGRK